MSRSDDFPLFSHWLKTLDWFMDLSQRLPKDLRYSLNNRILNHALNIMELISRAIYSKKRLQLLEELNKELEILRILMRICHGRHLISHRQYRFVSEQIDQAGRMTGGWIKKSK